MCYLLERLERCGDIVHDVLLFLHPVGAHAPKIAAPPFTLMAVIHGEDFRIAIWFGETGEKNTARYISPRLVDGELLGECVESATAHKKLRIQLRTSGRSIRIE
jgi:hypothetical protein